jgi:hypothetical protein
MASVCGDMQGKAGSTKFNIGARPKQTDAFIGRCLDNPREKAYGAMTTVKK